MIKDFVVSNGEALLQPNAAEGDRAEGEGRGKIDEKKMEENKTNKIKTVGEMLNAMEKKGQILSVVLHHSEAVFLLPIVNLKP